MHVQAYPGDALSTARRLCLPLHLKNSVIEACMARQGFCMAQTSQFRPRNCTLISFQCSCPGMMMEESSGAPCRT